MTILQPKKSATARKAKTRTLVKSNPHASNPHNSSSNDSSLLLLDVGTFHKKYPSLIQKLIRQNKGGGIFISFNKSLTDVIAILQKERVMFKDLFIINGINNKEECRKLCLDGKNRYCLDSPQALSDLCIHLTSLISTGNYHYIVFDNLSAFLIYNELETTQRFVHYVLGKISNAKLKATFLVLDDTKGKSLVETVSPFFDKYIKM
ncbi:hypothetical protein HYV86_02455 [Candidatus Woesearchaeota archaeon]|nr:hypothetical protein [Candidatus Woesearchaeota archaeon]